MSHSEKDALLAQQLACKRETFERGETSPVCRLHNNKSLYSTLKASLISDHVVFCNISEYMCAAYTRGGGHMKGMGMLVGNFELNP